MAEEIINKDELKNLRFLLQSGQKLAISTKEFEKVFDEIDRLEQENAKLKEALEKIKRAIEPCKASDSCFTCKFAFCANYEVAKIIKEVSE